MYNSYSALNLLGGMLYTVILLVVAYFVLKIVANWKIFEKAGQPGWASIVPFYSNYIEFNIYWGKMCIRDRVYAGGLTTLNLYHERLTAAYKYFE